MTNVITREEARAQGLKHYFTGQPCPRGHIAVRFVSVGNCKECARERAMEKHVHTTTKRRAYNDQASFIAAATNMHNGKYLYHTANYAGAHTKLEIQCPQHGSFWQNPTNHMQGKGCPACSFAATGKRCRKNTASFLEAARMVWGEDMWDYSHVHYVRAHAAVSIRCKEHDVVLTQSPTNHLGGQNPCSRCNHMKSAGERELFQIVSTYALTEPRNRDLIKPKEIDIYLPEHRLAIEYNGMFHHSHGSAEAEQRNKFRHFDKYAACADRGIRLLTIYEAEWQDRQQAIRRLIRNATGKMRGRLMARKCELRKATVQEAREFYEKYHPQGGNGNGEHYALFWKGKMVACMRFVLGANDRGAAASRRKWTLGRYATRISVAGAASRLFKAFVREFNPTEVKSFSDNRLFAGGMYEQLGFVLDGELAPDYQVWSPRIGLKPKAYYQRSAIPARLLDHNCDDSFDPATDPRTEMEMTYLMGARRIYDCGKKRWLWTSPSTVKTTSPTAP